MYLGAVAAAAAFGYAYSYLSAVVAQQAIAAIRVRLFAHLARLPVSYLDRTPLGDTISRATADVATIDTLFTDGIAALVGQLASLVAVAAAMVAISPVLSAVSLVVIPPLALASRWLQVRVRDAERRTRVAIGGLNTQLSETVGGAETIRAFSREAAFAARFRAGLRQALTARKPPSGTTLSSPRSPDCCRPRLSPCCCGQAPGASSARPGPISAPSSPSCCYSRASSRPSSPSATSGTQSRPHSPGQSACSRY